MVIIVQTPANFLLNPINHKPVPDKAQSWSKEKLKEALKSYDLNGDGKLSKEEIKQAFTYLGSNCGSYRAWKAMSHADTDGSGYVDLTDKELEELADYAYKCGYKMPSK